MGDRESQFGPCCFCGEAITETRIDPCRVQVYTNENTEEEKWQVWYAHGACFKARLANTLEEPDRFESVFF